jgi:PHD/YefM family antitoxin component YafN of YafNO toxin-antitoxin module
MIRKFKRKKFPLQVLLQENHDPVIVLAKNQQAVVHKPIHHVKPPT